MNTRKLSQFSENGSRLLADDGSPTKAGFREIKRLELIARGATESAADFLASAKITKSKRGTWAVLKFGTAAAMTQRECDFLNLAAGPGNY
jgi:hypothetical protein